MRALILAAGLGTRLRPHSLNTPKPLFTIGEQTVIDRMIRALVRAGASHIMVNTHHLGHLIQEEIVRNAYPVTITVRHEPEILGTGGAIRQFADLWADAPLLVANADVVTDIDLQTIYHVHRRGRHPVTLVVHDDDRFNSVWVDDRQQVVGFQSACDVAGPREHLKRLAFTGIQVIDPVVVDYIAPVGFASSIDAYCRMLADGRPLGAHIVTGHYWQDIGTPSRYRQAVLDHLLAAAWGEACGRPLSVPPRVTAIAGDGSDRRWYRAESEGRSLIVADHGIGNAGMGGETDAFIHIGRHLASRGIPVPRIHAYDRFSGIVVTEDLGDRHLQDEITGAADSGEIIDTYHRVIDQLVNMGHRGADGFRAEWTCQSPAYTREFILEMECRYFVDAFLNGWLSTGHEFADFEKDFVAIAEGAVSDGIQGFIHRDCQSRNIMLKNGVPHFIDFQGGRMGPVQYDLAALLIDPYVALAPSIQEDLFDYAAVELTRRWSCDRRQVENGYRHCALARNLQMLGAFGFLTRVKHKPQFADHIPPAVRQLRITATGVGDRLSPRFHTLIDFLVDTCCV